MGRAGCPGDATESSFGRPPHCVGPPPEFSSALTDPILSIHFGDESVKSLLQRRRAYAVRMEIEIEEGAALPRLGVEKASISMEPIIKRRAREGGLQCDLNFVKSAFFDKIEYPLNASFVGTIQPQNETSIDGDAVALYAVNGLAIPINLPRLPIGLSLNTLHPASLRVLEANEHLGTTAVAEDIEQFRVGGEGHIGLCKPANVLGGDGANKVPGVAFVSEGIVIRQFNEGLWPDFLDAPYFCDHVIHRLNLEVWGKADAGCAKLTREWTAALGLDRQSVVAFNIEQFEARHGRKCQIERLAAGVISWLKAMVLKIVDDAGPHGLSLAQDDGVGVARGFLGSGRDMEPPEEHPRARRTIAIGQRVRVFNLGRETRDGHHVEFAREMVHRTQVRHFKIADSNIARRHTRQGKERKTRQRCDNLAPLHKSGKRKAKFKECGVLHTHATHGDETEVHGRV